MFIRRLEVITNPSIRLQSNATFWYAETFYRSGVYNKAAINYLQSYKKYPKGSKAPDALLKLSYTKNVKYHWISCCNGKMHLITGRNIVY